MNIIDLFAGFPKGFDVTNYNVPVGGSIYGGFKTVNIKSFIDNNNNVQDNGVGTSMNNPDGFSHTDDKGYGVVCLLEDMMVMLNNKLSSVVNVEVGDIVSGSIVTEVMKKHMRNSYYIINNELKITNDHPVLTNSGWKRTEEVNIGDYINNVKVETIDFIEKIVPTVYIGTSDESFDVYCSNNIYTVHGQYKQLLKKAS